MTPRRLGLIATLTSLALDQASKAAVLAALPPQEAGRAWLTPFLDLTLQFNRGISFSLFRQDTAQGRAALILITLAVTAVLAVWMWRTRTPLSAAGLGAIVGGAIGNGLDRLVHGAVVDFLALHAFGYEFFVFNIADAAINLGVAALIIDALFFDREAS